MSKNYPTTKRDLRADRDMHTMSFGSFKKKYYKPYKQPKKGTKEWDIAKDYL